MTSTFPRSGVLALALDSVQAVLPSTLISQVESLLDSHRFQDAAHLADAQLTKLQGNVLDPNEAEELCYVYQRIGFQCFNETLFEDAGKNLFNGDLDPRLLISYYPDLRGSLFTADDTMEVFAGVAEYMPMDDSVYDIIVTNLVRNYSPYLAPNTRSAPPTVELRKILEVAAKEMLEVFLSRWRKRWLVNLAAGEPTLAIPSSSRQTSTTHPSVTVVDTVLAKLYCEFGGTAELSMLLQERNCVILSEVEPLLIQKRQYPALCMLYKERGEDLKLLEAWSKLIDGEWMDEVIKDPLSDMITLLTEKKEGALIRQWGVWLMKRDPNRALKLLMLKDSGRRRERPEEDLGLLEEIRDANLAAGIQFLEYLVLEKRSTSRELHTRLALLCVEQLSAAVNDDSVAKLWRAKVSSYRVNPPRTSFLSYFVSTAPDSTHKHLRLKTILFLAGSNLYNPAVIYSQILAQRNILQLELAIIEGMLGNHSSALATLAHDLHDYMTAEAYCVLGGAVVSARSAQLMAESGLGLELWVSALFGTAKPTVKPALHHGQMSSDEELKRELLKILMGVYMDSGEQNSRRIAFLLNSQTVDFDALDIVNLIPLHWPINLVSPFFARSFDRMLHDQYEGKIMKAINAGQNIILKEQTWLVLRQHGMVVEEAVEGSEDLDKFEDPALSEKLALQLDTLASNMFSNSTEGKKEM